MTYDIAIIGTGPAGLEAAITAKVRNKSVLLIGSKESSIKVSKAHAIANYLGLPDIKGEDMQKAFLEHAEKMGVKITEDRIQAAYAMGESFMLQGMTNMYEASTLILATGVIAAKPYPQEEQLLGRGVSYCATCDAALYKGKNTIVIASSPKEESEADFLAEYAAHVTYIPLYQDEVHVKPEVEVQHVKPLAIEGDNKVTGLQTDTGTIPTDGIFILREAIAPGQLVPGLETVGPHVKVDLNMATNIPGCFAAGDIAGTPYQYIKSAGQGNVAALSAVSYLVTKKLKG